MADDIMLQISIPADQDGFILLKCPICGTFFKVMVANYESDDNLGIVCPSCGLKSDSYFTEEVLELAENMAQNVAIDLIEKEFKSWERKFSGGSVSFKSGNKIEREYENRIVAGIEALEVVEYSCCHKKAKIKILNKMVGAYCPFCGVKNFEVE